MEESSGSVLLVTFHTKIVFFTNTLYLCKTMNTKKINIKNPSKEVLDFFRNMRWAKQEKKASYIAKKDIYFPKASK